MVSATRMVTATAAAIMESSGRRLESGLASGRQGPGAASSDRCPARQDVRTRSFGSRLARLADAQAVVDIHHAWHAVGAILGQALLGAVLHHAVQRHLAVIHGNGDFRPIHVPILGQARAHLVPDARILLAEHGRVFRAVRTAAALTAAGLAEPPAELVEAPAQ